MYKWVSGIAKNRAWTRIETLWGDIHRISDLGEIQNLVPKLQCFADEFEQVYKDHVEPDSGVPLDKVYGDLSHILLGILDILDKLPAAHVGDDDVSSSVLVSIAVVFDRMLALVEKIVRDEKYRQIVKSTPEVLAKVLTLLEKTSSTEGKIMVLKVVVHLGQTNEDKLAISQMNGIQKILQLLSSDPRLLDQINRTLQHFLQDSNASRSLSREGSTSSPTLSPSNSQQLAPALGSLVKVGLTMFARASQHIVKIVGSQRGPDEATKDSQSPQVPQQVFKYSALPALRVAHVVESVELLQLAPSARSEGAHAATGACGSVAPTSDSDQSHCEEVDNALADRDNQLVKELMILQGIMQKLTHHIKEAACDIQVELISTLGQVMQGSAKAQSLFKSLDGYSIIGTMLSSVSNPDSPSSSAMLDQVFLIIEATARDLCGEYVGNIDAFLFLAKLACGSHHLAIRWRAAHSIMVLINENPENAAVFLAIRGFHMLIDCLPPLPPVSESYSDPLHSHFRNFLFYAVQVILAGATLLDEYSLAIVECMAAALLRQSAIPELPSLTAAFCQPIVQSVLVQCIFTALSHHSFISNVNTISLELVESVIALIDVSSSSCIIDLSADVSISDTLKDPWNKTAAEHGIIDSIYMTEIARMVLLGLHSDLTSADAISRILTIPRLLAAVSSHCVSNLVSTHALFAVHSALLSILELLHGHLYRGVAADTSTNSIASHLRTCTRELASTVVMSYSQKDTPTVKRILALKVLAHWCHTAYVSYPHVSEVYRASLMSFDAVHSIFGTWRLAGPELARSCLISLFAFMHSSKFVRSRVQAAMSPLQFAANICNNSNLKWDPCASFMLFSILGMHPDSGQSHSPLSSIQALSALPLCGLVQHDSSHVLWTGLRWPIVVEPSSQGASLVPLVRSPSGEISCHVIGDCVAEQFRVDSSVSFQNVSYSNFQFHSEYEASVAIHVVDQCAPSSQAHLSHILAEILSQSPRNCLLASNVKGLEIFVDRFALLGEADESRNGIMALITKLGQYSIRSQALSGLLKCALDDPSLDKNLQALFVIGEICGRDSPSSYFELLRKAGSHLLISYPDRLPNEKVGFTIACWLRVWEWGGDTSTLFEFRDHSGNCFAEVTLMKSLEHDADPCKRLVCIEVLADAKQRAKSPARAKSPIPVNFASVSHVNDPAVSSASRDASSGLFQFTSYEYKADGCWQLLTISFSKNGVALSINGKSLQTLGNVAYPSNVRSMQVILGSESQDNAMHATVGSVSVYEGVVDSALCSTCYESGAISSVAPRVTSAKKPLLVLAPQLFSDRNQKDSLATTTLASIIDPLASQLLSFLAEIPKQDSDSQSQLSSDAPNSLSAQRRSQATGGEVGFTDRLLAGFRSFRDDSSEVDPKERDTVLSSPQKSRAFVKDATTIGSGVVVHLTSFIWEAINQKTGALRLLKAVANLQSQVAALQVLTRLLNGSAPLRDNFADAFGYHALTAVLQTPKALNNEILECLTSIASCSLSVERRPLKDAHCAVLLADLLLHVDARTQQAILAQISDSITGLADARVIWREHPDLKYSKFTLWLDELAPECRRLVAMIIGSNFDSFQAPDVQFVCQWLMTKPGSSMDIRADLIEHLVELWFNGTASLSLLRPSNPKSQHEAFDFALALMLNPHDGIQSAAVRLLSMILCSSKSASEYFHKTHGWLAVVAAVCESKQYTSNAKGPGPELCKALLCAAMGNLSTSSSSHSGSSSINAQKLVDPNAIQALILFLSERDAQSHIVSTMLLKLISIIVASGADPTKEKPEYQSASNMSIMLADAGMLHWLKILWRRWGDSDPDLSSIMLLSRSASQSDLAAIFAQDRLRSESESSRTGSIGTSDDTDESDADERSEADSISTDGTGAPMADSVRVLIRSLARIICLADLLRSKPRLPTLLAPEIDDDTDVWGRLVRAEVVHAFDRMPRLFEANTTSALKAFVALMQPMLLHQGPKDIFILMGLIQTIKNLTLRSTPAVRGSFADSGFSKLSDDSCRVSCRAAIVDPELASILLASNSLGEFALMPVFSKFECTDVLALLLVLHRSMADREPRGALVRRSAISLRDRLGSDPTWRASLLKTFDEDAGNRDVANLISFFSKGMDDDAAQAWLKSYMTSGPVESREALDALLQRKWQQLHLPSSSTSIKSKEGESQWSSFFYSLFDKGGSEEAGSLKARAEKAKKLADYDRRLQESKENVANWITQIKAIVDASRKVLDDGASAMREGARARILQGQKALQKLGEAHTHVRHRRNDSGSGISQYIPPHPPVSGCSRCGLHCTLFFS